PKCHRGPEGRTCLRALMINASAAHGRDAQGQRGLESAGEMGKRAAAFGGQPRRGGLECYDVACSPGPRLAPKMAQGPPQGAGSGSDRICSMLSVSYGRVRIVER